MSSTGTVKKFNKEKGFGFISDENGKDVFFHYSQLQMGGFKNIEAGAKVTFDAVETDKGLQAHNIVEVK